MAKLIRKISIGTDYKNEAMHYSVGQEVYGGHTISDILEEDGWVNLEKASTVSLIGLDGYSLPELLNRFNYAKPNEPTIPLI